MSNLVKGAGVRHIHVMMLRGFVLAGLLLGALSLPAAPLRLDRLKVGTRIYSGVSVVGANVTDLYFTHSEGIANVKLRLLEPSLQKRFNYDPKAAETAEKVQEEDDTKYRNTIASN